MGRDSGYIGIQCGIGGGAEMVMIPETHTTIDTIIQTLSDARKKSKTSSIIVVAEGDEEGNANIISEKVKKVLPHLDIRVTTLGHIQRGGSPSAYDRILASRLGLAAIEGLLKGEKNVMAGIINDKLIYTPFKDTIQKAKEKAINDDLLRMINILSL
jgi:6-phosphofructokinase 1